jgi:FeS assembly SUF system regulator
MIKINKLTDYAIVILFVMAKESQKRYTSTQLAASTGVPDATVAKLLKKMVSANLVESHRGSQGGYVLRYAKETITIRQIVEALDGPLAVTDCVMGGKKTCTAEQKCPLRGNWDKINQAIIGALDGLKLQDMMIPNEPIKKIVTIAAE